MSAPLPAENAAEPIPYYLPIGDECELFERAYRRTTAAFAQRSNRLRQDALRRAYGGEVGTTAFYNSLS